jgi:hypothetical protein
MEIPKDLNLLEIIITLLQTSEYREQILSILLTVFVTGAIFGILCWVFITYITPKK